MHWNRGCASIGPSPMVAASIIKSMLQQPGTWPSNYRIPDLVLLTPERFHIDCNEYFDGGPDAVVEIHSPGDEAYEKLPFYASVGVREVLVIDRDTRQPELYELVGGEFQIREPGPQGWVKCELTGIELRAAAGEKLEIRIVGRDDSRAQLP